MTTAAVVLAAGGGSRFGGGKLRAPFRGRPLVAWALDAAVEAALDETVVVTGEDGLADLVPAGVTVLDNPRWAQGQAGTLQVAVAHARGVDAVWVREPDPERLARAEAWGAAAHGNEPVDVAVVCTESPDAIAAAAGCLAPGGTLCLYAPPEPGEPLGVDGWTVFKAELRVTASWSAGPADMRAALALLRRGAIRTGELITGRYSLEETGEALAAQRDGRALKAVVVP